MFTTKQRRCDDDRYGHSVARRVRRAGLRERTEQLLMDGYAVDSVIAAEVARARLAEGRDAVILGDDSATIGVLRELRAVGDPTR